ncbi:MAG: glycoside hydrolase [Ruminococcus sp.]|nr:glycoside hydrolase [Ruminococcus sp.]
MDKLRYIAALTAAAIAAVPLAGCSKSGGSSGSGTDSAASTEVSTVPEPTATFPDYPITYPEIEETRAGTLYEAEKAALKGPLVIEYDKENYSGEGYVTGFTGDDSSSVTFSVEAPTNQHYDISFNVAADKAIDCIVELNENSLTTFKTRADGKFTQVTLRGVFLTKGKSEISLRPKNGNICVDYLKLENSSALGDISYTADSSLSNKNAGDSAKVLMKFLTDNYGKYIITGQYAADDDNSELDLIYTETGKYPVIRFSNFYVPKGSFDESFKLVDAAADWYRNGGISGVTWYWTSPSKKSSIYSAESDFDLSKAVTGEKIALLTQEEIRGLYGEGKISEQTYSLILDIDNMAGQLTSLKNKGVPVLWRPLPEGSGDWYWWGKSGSDAYKWLWQLLYDRLTTYFELDNLIWIWNGQSQSTLVDRKTFDIAAVDFYVDGERDYGDRFYEKFGGLQKIAGKNKLIALSECGSVPDADSSFRDKSVWSFFALWSGEYIENEKGEYSDKYTGKKSLIRLYNSEGALTLDEYRDMTGYKPPETTAASEENTGDTAEDTTGASSETETAAETTSSTAPETTAPPATAAETSSAPAETSQTATAATKE